MIKTVMKTNTLPKYLLGIIPTEKVCVKEVCGEIHLIPVGEPIKRPFSELRGILRGKVWMSDDFDAPLDEMKEYME